MGSRRPFARRTGTRTITVPPSLQAALADRYRLERELGSGGMATVYLAHDLRHEREVAIKVLHPDLAAALGGERFLAEIKTTAKLNHPHILPLLDSGAAGGFLFYVMPHVSGETLRARLERERQLPMDDALRLAREVADALGAAHAHGIIHRDIKPENILLQGGHALVADFGIALAVQSAGGARMTQTGLSLGTPQYMAPEQAMGERTIDARADQYALAAVTYEMLGGEPPFTGPTVQAIIAKALSERPVPLHTLRDTVPASVERAVLRALSKLPADRFGTTQEFALALAFDHEARGQDWQPTGATRPGARAPAAGAWLNRASLLAGGAMLVVGALVGWMLGHSGGASTSSRGMVTRFALEALHGERTPVTIAKVFAISPDGSTLVYAALRAGAPQQLYRRRFDELGAEPIAGTVGATNPVFSPDGRWLAYFTGSQLMKIPVEGGAAIPLTPVDGAIARGLTWSEGGEVIYATNSSRSLHAVSQDGGKVRNIFDAPGSIGLRWPVAIPGSDQLLFQWWAPAGDTVTVVVGSLKDGTTHALGVDAYHALGVIDGYLVFLTRSGDIMAAPFDLRAGRVNGVARSVARGVQMNTGTGFGHAVLARSGDLVFRDGSTASQLIYADARGTTRVAVPDTLGYENPRFSHDGRRIALSVATFDRKDLFLVDRASGILTRFTEDVPEATFDRAEWTPDDKRLLYRRNSPDGNRVMIRPSDLSGPEARLPVPRAAVNEATVLPDGATILARVSSGAAASQDLWWWTFSDTTPHMFTTSAEFETGGRNSPDGKWVAYTAETGGTRDVYVAPFPGPGGRVRVSREGAGLPVWGPDSHTLYFPQDRRLMVATLSFSPSVSVVSSRTVLDGEFAFDDPLHAPFDVGPDGTIVLVRPLRDPRTIVIRNFAAEMRRQLARQGGAR